MLPKLDETHHYLWGKRYILFSIQIRFFSLKHKPRFPTLVAVNSSEWANAVLPSQVCQDLCSLPSSNSCSIEETRLFHTVFQNPRTAAKQRNTLTPLPLPGWLVEAESRIIPTGDEHKNTEIKQRNIFFYQIVPFTSWVQDASKKTCFLAAHMEAGCLGCAPSTVVCWESLNVTSSWDRFHHQGCALLCHISPQQLWVMNGTRKSIHLIIQYYRKSSVQWASPHFLYLQLGQMAHFRRSMHQKYTFVLLLSTTLIILHWILCQ